MIRRWIGAITLCVCVAGPVSALTINPTYTNSAGQTWTATRQGVVQAAIDDFEAVLLDSVSIDIEFDFVAAGGGGYLGQWSGGFLAFSGTDIYPWSPEMTHTIHLNSSLIAGLFFDPTPADASDLPFHQWDVLSVMRHELGHALGFSEGLFVDNFNTPSEFDKWGIHMVGDTFDPNGLNVAMATGDSSHIFDGGVTEDDLMVQILTNGERRSISQISLDMLELAYGWTVGSVAVAGDINGGGLVNVADLGILAAQWGTAGSPPHSADIAPPPNGDGTVNVADLGFLAANWSGQQSPSAGPGATAIPSPPAATGALALAGVLGLTQRRRR